MNLQENIGKESSLTKKWDQKLFQFAKEFLLSFKDKGITEEDINLHLKVKKLNDIKEIYKQFCLAAQNRQSRPKVISGSIEGGIDKLGEVLFDFTPKKVAEKYNKTSAQELLNVILEKIKPTGKVNENKGVIWPQYCRSVIDSAHFLKSFDTAKEFYDWANSLSKNERLLIISKEVFGFGEALACDFLKEIGYEEYGKPDVHLKNIFKALGMINQGERNQDYEVLKLIGRIAQSNDETDYAVDKVFWLIGSGNFYRSKPEKNIGRQRKKFISEVKNKIGTYK